MRKLKMRKLIILLLSTFVLLSSTVRAEQNEVQLGALTQHFTNFDGVSSRFSNKVSRDGTLIANPMGAWRIIKTEGLIYTSSAVFGGENSVGELMGGVAASTGVIVDHLKLGVAAGGYLQDNQKFRDRGITPFGLNLGDRLGLCPIAGVELSIDVPLDHDTYMTIYTLVTPILSTTTVGFGWTL